jgi:hypothetical protein
VTTATEPAILQASFAAGGTLEDVVEVGVLLTNPATSQT